MALGPGLHCFGNVESMSSRGTIAALDEAVSEHGWIISDDGGEYVFFDLNEFIDVDMKLYGYPGDDVYYDTMWDARKGFVVATNIRCGPPARRSESTDIRYFNDTAIERLENGMIIIAGLTYNRRGKVVDFGNSKGQYFCQWRDANGEMRFGNQACWKLLYVTVFVDGFDGVSRAAFSNHDWQGWVWYKEFWAGSWDAIAQVFQFFFATAGLYHNAQFRVDIMRWTRVNGWQYDDLL